MIKEEAKRKNVPEVRFEGFEGEWERKKLREIGSTFSGLSGKTKADFGHGKARYITYMNVFSNPIANPKQLDLIEIDDTQNKVQYGDVLFTTSSETPEEVGMSSVWLQNMENIYLNSFCFGYRPDIDINNEFLAYLLRSDSIRDKFIFLAQGISRYNISKTRVMDISLPLPSVQEQSQIGTLFHQLDNQISQHRTKLQKLQQVKQAMLTKMFPQDGAKVPEVRFEGFEGDWERKKLGDVADSFEYGLNAASKPYDGQNKYLRITDIDDNSRHFKNDDLTSPNTNLSKAENYKLSSGDILFARTGASVGKTYIYNESDGLVYFAGFLIRARIKKQYNSNFIFQNTLTYSYENFVRLTSQRSGQPGINAQEYADYCLFVPTSYNEQSQIGSFFQQLDTLLAQHQKQLDKLGQIKSALLDKMFV